MKNKKLMMATLALSAISCFAFGIANVHTTSAAERVTASGENFTVEQSAEMRLTAPYGMRYKLKMGATEYENLTDVTDDGVMYEQGKTLQACIMPKSFADGITDNDWGNVPQGAIKEINPETIYLQDGYYYANVVFTKVQYQNYNVDFVLMAYMDDGVTQTYTAVPAVGYSFAYTTSATLALGGYQTTQQETDLNAYVQKALCQADGLTQTESETAETVIPTLTLAATYSIEKGKTATLSATVTPNADLYKAWASDNTDVVTVDDKGVITAVSEGTANVSVTVYGVTKTCEVTVTSDRQYGYFDFNGFDVGATDIATVTGGTQEIVQDGNNKVWKLTLAGATAQYYFITLSKDLIGDFSKFDYIEIEMAMENTANGIIGLGGAYLVGDCYYTNNSESFGHLRGKTHICRFSKADSISSISINNGIKLYFKPYVASDLTLTIKSIKGGYNDIQTDGATAIDLTTKCQLSANEFTATFTPTGGTATTVLDVSKFVAHKDGVLTITVNKEGYKQSTIEVNVTKVMKYGYFDFNGFNVGATSVATLTRGTQEIVQDGENKGWKLTVNDDSSSSYSWITLPASIIGDFSKFDYVDITMSMTSTVNGYIAIADVGVYDGKTASVDGFGEVRDRTATLRWSSDSAKLKQSIKTYQGIKMYLVDWGNVENTYTVTIKSIKGGYNDITSDGATAINLTEKFGSYLTSATFTPTGGAATAVSNLTSFVNTASGILTLTFKTNGYAETKYTVNYTVG